MDDPPQGWNRILGCAPGRWRKGAALREPCHPQVGWDYPPSHLPTACLRVPSPWLCGLRPRRTSTPSNPADTRHASAYTCVHGVGVAFLGGKYQRCLAILISSIHIGVVRTRKGVHGVGVGSHGGHHQRGMASLIHRFDIRGVRASESITVSVWPKAAPLLAGFLARRTQTSPSFRKNEYLIVSRPLYTYIHISR